MSTCFLESRDCSGCGHFSGVSAPISLLECQDDVSSHLKYYHLSSKILEYELILFRSGHFGLEMGKLKQMFVCSKTLWENIGNVVKVLVSIQSTKENKRERRPSVQRQTG